VVGAQSIFVYIIVYVISSFDFKIMPKFSKKFNNLIDFVNFTHEFQQVTRVARIPFGNRMENDAEHSYQLAMVAWFLIDQDKLKLNKELCFMYALSHDLIEVYAGDTPVHDKKASLSKHAREEKALKKIKKKFSNFKSLISVIDKYEKRVDEESKFIYALDKILPLIQCYLEKGAIWKEYNMSLQDVIDNKNKKIALSKSVDVYWQELLAELTKNKKKLFPKN
jgi:putative hydrolases of HD superfamily